MKQLSSYKAQLQQVEVALSTDQDNEDLLKLQKDLQVCTCTRLCQFDTVHQTNSSVYQGITLIVGLAWKQIKCYISVLN